MNTQPLDCEVIENTVLNKKFFYCRQHKKECESNGCLSPNKTKQLDLLGDLYPPTSNYPQSTATLSCATGIWTVKGKGYWEYSLSQTHSKIDSLTYLGSLLPPPDHVSFYLMDDATYCVDALLGVTGVSLIRVSP